MASVIYYTQSNKKWYESHIHSLTAGEVAVLVDDKGMVEVDKPHEQKIRHSEVVYEYQQHDTITGTREIIEGEHSYTIQGKLQYSIEDVEKTHRLMSTNQESSCVFTDSHNTPRVSHQGSECLSDIVRLFLRTNMGNYIHFHIPKPTIDQLLAANKDSSKEQFDINNPSPLKKYIEAEFTKYFGQGLKFTSFDYTISLPKPK